MPELLTQTERNTLFPVTRDWAYLDNARRGPLSSPAAAASAHYIEGLRDGGVTAWPQWQTVWDQTNAAFATFVGADVDEIQFLVNATESLARVTLGIDWQGGDHAVAFARDYPGLVRPLLDLRRRGVEVTLVPDRPDFSRSLDDLFASFTPRTRLAAASWVDFRTGFKLDAAAFAQGCRERGVLSVLDAVQAVGAMPVDMHAVGCDFATFAIRKYLCGLDTLGVLYVRRDSLEALRPHTQGLFSVANPFDFDTLEQPYADGAKRFALGTPALVQVYSLQAALELQRPRRDAIHARLAELRDIVLAQAPRALAHQWPESSRSHIVAIAGALADWPEKLSAARVAASVRNGVLRVSPHWYNSDTDVGRMFDALGTFPAGDSPRSP
jgi:selenocysteine lyase/cysteine desulfurase